MFNKIRLKQILAEYKKSFCPATMAKRKIQMGSYTMFPRKLGY